MKFCMTEYNILIFYLVNISIIEFLVQLLCFYIWASLGSISVDTIDTIDEF